MPSANVALTETAKTALRRSARATNRRSAMKEEIMPVDTGRLADVSESAARGVVRHRRPDDVAAQHREKDERARKNPEPRLGRHRRLRLIQHVAPARRRRLHAHAEEAERTLEQDAASHRERRRHGSRGKHAWENVTNHDPG